MRSLCLFATLCGCATLPIRSEAGHADRDVIDASAAGLGLQTEHVTDGPAIEVELWDGRRGGDLGYGRAELCGGEAGFVRDSDVGRHELGHALGLQHVDDPGNVMSDTSVGGDQELTQAQRRTVRASVARLQACRRAQ